MNRQRTTSTAEATSVLATTWRPAWELFPVSAWLSALLGYMCLRAEIVFRAIPDLAACFGCVLLVLRAATLWGNLRERAELSGYATELCSLEAMRNRYAQAYLQESVYFGDGFLWTPECTQRLYELSKVDAARLELPAWLARVFARHPIKMPSAAGLGYLHGVGRSSHPILVPQKTLEGGTLIVGTTQSGKGVLLTQLIAQAILRGDSVIVIDPKNSPRTFRAMTQASKAAGRPSPFFFHPSGSGIRMNPLRHFNRISEVAGRVTAILDETGPFAAFAWNAVHIATTMLEKTGRAITLANLLSTLQRGFGDLLVEAVSKRWGEDEFAAVYASIRASSERERLLRTFELFEQTIDADEDPELSDALSAFRHDPEHYSKIIASMIPPLTMLTSGALRQCFSATESDPSAAPLVDLKDVIDHQAVLYVATDALPDAKVSQAIGSLLIAELASIAGYRYNARAKGGRVSLFIDECSSVMQSPLIELLNKGAEAGIETTCAMQTVSDLAAKLGSDAAAQMALGNFNTVVCLRTKDPATAEFISKSFGKTYVAMQEASLATHAGSDSLQAFQAGQTQKLTSSREDRIPAECLGALPNAEYFASIAGGRLVKGRVPILTDEEVEP